MATQTINTRIKNKVDSITNWQESKSPLLDGEIAIVRVETGSTYTNPITGKAEPVVELLMKVGNGTASFADLPWLSAKASDVYDWAKVQDPSTINVTYNGETSTLANVLKDVKAASAAVSSKLSDITVNQSGTGVVKSVTKGATGAVTVSRGTVATAEIADTAITTAKIADAGVTTAKIADNSITNAKVSGDIAASKIVYSGSGGAKITVAAKLESLDSTLANIKGSLSIDPATAVPNGVVQGITYNSKTGKFTVSYGTVATDDITAKAVTTAKIADSAITTAKIADSAVTDVKIAKVSASKVEVAAAAGDTAAVMLPAKLSAIDGEISSIKSAIAGGTHFVGTTTTALFDGATTNPITVGSKSHTPVAGDIVLYDNKEFIWTGNAWEELGDLTRVGALETWRGKLVKADAAIANQFVTEVDIAADGTVSIGRAQPTSTNIKHGDSGTVSSVLIDHTSKLTGLTNSTVQESINAKINALDLTTDPASGGEAVSTENFVTQVRQTDGKVSYSRKTLPKASTSKAGIVQLADGTSSSDATKAATAASTKSAYDKAVNAQGRISTVEGNYVRFANDKLYVGLTGADEIIFDCGTSANL